MLHLGRSDAGVNARAIRTKNRQIQSGFVGSSDPASQRRAPFLAVLLSMVIWLAVSTGQALAQDDFLNPEDAFRFSAAMGAPDRLDVHFKVAPKYYMYRDRFSFVLEPEADAALLGQPVFPPGLVQYDPTFDEEMEVYYGQYTFQIPLQAGASQPLTLTVVSQGCADAGLCYSPMDSEVTLTPVAGGYAVAGQGVVTQVPDIAQSTPPQSYAAVTGEQASALDTGNAAALGDGASQTSGSTFGQAMGLGDMGLAAYLSQAHVLEIIALSLALGLLLSFTPCVLPMVPILLAVLAGESRSLATISRWRALALSATFVLGMSLVYTALGVAAGLIGASIAVWLQTPWVLSLFAIVLGVLALAMFNVFKLQVPTAMQSALTARLNKIPGGRYSGVFVMGMVSALIVGPCIAAPLAGVLLFISQTGDVVLGGTALFSMAWGSGLLLLVVGMSSGALLPKAGPWMEGVKRLFGVMLLATAWWMVNSVLPAAVMIVGWAFLAMWSAVMLGGFARLAPGAGIGRLIAKALGVILALWAAILIVGVAAGGRDVLQPLKPFVAVPGSGVATAAAGSATSDALTFVAVDSTAELDHIVANTDRPVMLDFYADWCVSCIEMERFTFSDPAVAQRMAQFTLVQADVTRNQPEHRELLKRFNLFGPPGIIFFDTAGNVMADARVVGFQNAEKFGAVLDQVLSVQVQ